MVSPRPAPVNAFSRESHDSRETSPTVVKIASVDTIYSLCHPLCSVPVRGHTGRSGMDTGHRVMLACAAGRWRPAWPADSVGGGFVSAPVGRHGAPGATRRGARRSRPGGAPPVRGAGKTPPYKERRLKPACEACWRPTPSRPPGVLARRRARDPGGLRTAALAAASGARRAPRFHACRCAARRT